MKNKFLFLWILSVALLVACGGGGGGSNDGGGTPPERPSGTINLMAFDAAIQNGTVRVYEYDNGVRGAVLQSGSTNSSGAAAVQIVSIDRPILIEVSGGRYTEPVSGMSVSLQPGQILQAAINYVSGNTFNVTTSYFTNLAVGYAEFLMITGTPANTAINTSNALFSSANFAGLDIITTVPLDITDTANASTTLTDGLLYGMLLSAISEWTANASATNSSTTHSLYNSIFYVGIAFADIKNNGILDGVGAGGPLSFGIIPVITEIYRHQFAMDVLTMANSSNNATGLAASLFVPAATLFNNSLDPMYNGEFVTPLGSITPVISNISHNNNDVVTGNVTFSAQVSDEIGVSLVNFLVDNTFHSSATDLSNPSTVIDTSTLSDGPHTFSIYVENVMTTSNQVDVSLVVASGTLISGVAFDNQITNGTVNIHAFDNAVQGVLLGTGTTSPTGSYVVQITSPSKPILVVIDGGRYTEPALGVSVNRPVGQQPLRAAVNYTSGTSATVNVTYFTNVAAGLASYLTANGQSASLAITTANSLFSGTSFAGVNIITTVPLDITDPANASTTLNNGLLYGMLLAAISEWTMNVSIANSSPIHSLYTSSLYCDIAYLDIIADGVLDGQGSSGSLSFGIIPVTTSIYRHQFAMDILTMANSSNNATGLAASVFVPAATAFNDSTDPIYNSVPITPLSSSIPSITNVSHNNNDVVTGNVTFSATVSDEIGVSLVNFLVDNVLHSSATNLSNPSTVIDTSTLSDGPHTFSIYAENVVTSSDQVDIGVIVASTATISGTVYTSSALVNALVEVRDYSNGIIGVVLGNDVTDGSGFYSINVVSQTTQLIVIASGGSYSEPLSNTNVSLQTGQSLRAVLNYTSGISNTVMITNYTNQAAGLAINLMSNGNTAAQAINLANNRLNVITGINIIGTTPLDISDASNATNNHGDSHIYGFLLASLSDITRDISNFHSSPIHTTYNSFGYMMLAYDDISNDGLLDGVGSSGAIAYGAFSFSTQIYRHNVAVSVIRVTANNINATTITINGIFNDAVVLNNNTDVLFAGIPITLLDISGPMISNMQPINDDEIEGNNFTVSATVIEPIGIGDVRLLIDNVLQSIPIDFSNPTWTVDTVTLGDGPHVFRIEVDGLSGINVSSSVNVLVNNVEHVYLSHVLAYIPNTGFPSRVGVNGFSIAPNGSLSQLSTLELFPSSGLSPFIISLANHKSIPYLFAYDVGGILFMINRNLGTGQISLAQRLDINTVNGGSMPISNDGSNLYVCTGGQQVSINPPKITVLSLNTSIGSMSVVQTVFAPSGTGIGYGACILNADNTRLYAYLFDSRVGLSQIDIFNRDSSTGALTFVTSLPSANTIAYFKLHPNGTVLYASGSNTSPTANSLIDKYAIDGFGNLSLINSVIYGNNCCGNSIALNNNATFMVGQSSFFATTMSSLSVDTNSDLTQTQFLVLPNFNPRSAGFPSGIGFDKYGHVFNLTGGTLPGVNDADLTVWSINASGIFTFINIRSLPSAVRGLIVAK